MRPAFVFLRTPSILAFAVSLSLLPQALAQTQVAPRIVEVVDNTRRIRLPGNVHRLASAEFDRGIAADEQPMNRVLLLLKRGEEQEAALQDFLERQQDKASPSYHQWLTPEEYGRRYGPADADMQTITQWLVEQGFQVNQIYSGRTIIEFSGTAGQLRGTFGTAIHNYEVGGKMYVANANDPQIPMALAPVVSGMVSLNNFPRMFYARYGGAVRRAGAENAIKPVLTFPNPYGGGNFYGMGPGDFATIYNSKALIAAGNDGKGQTIAVVGETDFNVQDVSDFRSAFGLPPTFNSSNVILNGQDPGVTSQDEESEADLDVQWSGAVAPGATVDFVVSASTPASAGIDLSALYIVEHNLASVMSESYGGCESELGTAGNAFYNSLWEQAAAQGITVVLAAGDGGSAGCDDFNTATAATQGLAVSGLASTPYNVSVGGTDFDEVNHWSTYWSASNDAATGTSALSYIPEIPWNESCAQIGITGCGASAPNGSLNIVAGSGGASQRYGKPTWQMGVAGMPNDNHRDQPDVSLFASPGFDGSGYLICQQDREGQCYSSGALVVQNLGVIGGTSASAPAFAGIIALVNQYQAAHGGSGRQGNANYVLYSLSKKSGASCVSSVLEAAGCIFNDITKGNSVLPTGLPGVGTNSVPCQGATPNCSEKASGNTGVLVDPNNGTTEAWTAAAGYDLATGLGSVNVYNLATNWGTVSTVATATTLTLSPLAGITHGTNETVNISVKPTTGVASGDVALIAKFTDGSTQGLDSFTLSGGSITNGTTLGLYGGQYSVVAHYAGDGTNAPSDSPALAVKVSPEVSKTFASLVNVDRNGALVSFGASTATYGAGFNFFRVDVGGQESTISSTAGVSSNCARGLTNCPTGTVALASTGASVGASSFLLNNLGNANTQTLNPGSYSVSASYPGDTSYGASAGSADFVISKAPTTITAGVASSVPYGNITQISIQLATTSLGIEPTGTFQFIVDGIPLPGQVPVYEGNSYSPSSSGINYAWADTQSTTEFLSIGNHTLAGTYSGDANYAAASSASVSLTVTKALPDIGSWGASPASINIGQQTTLVAQMYGSDAGVAPTGTMTFYDGATAVTGTVSYTPTPGRLSASLPYTPTTIGTHSITVNYSGDGNYLPTSSPIAATLSVIGPDFVFNPPNPASVTVNAGSPANYVIAITGMNGFVSNVNVSCSLPAAATTCSAMPMAAAAGSSTTILVTTSQHQAIVVAPSPVAIRIIPVPTVRPLLLELLSIIVVIVLIRRSRRRLIASFCLGATVLMLLQSGGCGGGGGVPPPPPLMFGTQPGVYTVTITGVSSGASNPVSHIISVTLAVN
jgi:subtilase family serine protease